MVLAVISSPTGLPFFLSIFLSIFIGYTGWAKLNGANAVSFVVVKHVLENFDNVWQMK